MSGASPQSATADRRGAEISGPLGTSHGWLYTSFADEVGGGNPAGVVISPEPLEDEVAQAVASVLSVPTTGFVVAPDAGAKCVDVRFFTPDCEIYACGHVTVAVAAALVEHGVWTWGDDVTVCARGGDFPLRLRDGAIEMTQRLRLLERTPLGWETVEAAFGRIARHPALRLAVAGTGLRHLLAPMARVEQLVALALDAGHVTRLARAAGVDTVCALAPTAEPGRFRVRDLCAAIGALEEPASGTTAATLALYLAAQGQLSGPELVIEQGVEMGRPSRIEVTVAVPETAIVRGAARKLLSGPLELWSSDGS